MAEILFFLLSADSVIVGLWREQVVFVGRVCLHIACAIILFLIALTYSRGTTLGVLVAMAAACFILKTSRLRILCLVAWFAAISLVTPHWLDRYAQVFPLRDRSVLNRLDVWKGAAVMLADHPIIGVGSNAFSQCYFLWYQHTNNQYHYGYAMNNLLGFGSEHGIPVFFVVSAVMIGVLFTSMRTARFRQDGVLTFLTANQITFHATGMFTQTATRPSIVLIYLLSVMLVPIRIRCLDASANWRLMLYQLAIRRSAFIGIACAVALSGGLLIAGFTYASRFPVKLIAQEQIWEEKAVTIAPRKKPPCTTVLLIESEYDPVEISHLLIKILTDCPANVIYCHTQWHGFSGLQKLNYFLDREVKRWPQNKFVFVGFGECGQLLLVSPVAQKMGRGIVAIASPASWPEPLLSPKEAISKVNVPILILHGSDDTQFSCEDMIDLVKLGRVAGRNIRIVVKKNTAHDLSQDWNWIVFQLHNFIETL